MNSDDLAEREQMETINDSKKERKETVEFNDLTNQDATLMNNKEDCDTFVKELQEKMKAQNAKFKKFKEKFDSDTQIKDERIKELEKSLKERVGIILKAEGYSNEQIDDLIEKVINTEETKSE